MATATLDSGASIRVPKLASEITVNVSAGLWIVYGDLVPLNPKA